MVLPDAAWSLYWLCVEAGLIVALLVELAVGWSS